MTDAVINPVKGRSSPNLSPLTILVSSETDLNPMVRSFGFDPLEPKRLSMSRVFPGEAVSLAGPVVGAPYAVLIMEALIAWGAKRILFVGWCGSISEEVKIGDIVIPSGALIEEGTSRLYGADETIPACPSPHLSDLTKNALMRNNIAFREGLIWSTDAVYRETHEKIGQYRSRQALAVEMEVSALFTVGKFRNVEVSAILVVSDELATLTWKPGFKDERFERGRKAVCAVISDIIHIP